MIEVWESMASVQPPFLVSVASLAMPPRQIFFSVVLICFRELCQLVQCIEAMGTSLTFCISCIVGRLLREYWQNPLSMRLRWNCELKRCL
jgi:hypothetical protein